MTKEEIQEKYRTIILPENKNPFHFEKKEGTETIQAYNSLCGDKYIIYLKQNELYFHGIGCAISKASTSLMLRTISGKSKKEMNHDCRTYLEAMDNNRSLDKFSEGLQVLGELKFHEGRVDCIQLSWIALHHYLKLYAG